MKSQVKPSSIIYDIGAYRGLYSSAMARIIKNSIIYAFEPNPDMYNELCEHIKLMKLSNRIIPKNMALGSDTGSGKLYITSNNKRSSLDKNFAIKDDVIIDVIEVDITSLDYLTENGICESPDVMKVDVQGYELEVLTGGKKTIMSKCPQIYIEPHKKKGGVSTKNRIIEFLSQLKYEHESMESSMWFYMR